MIRNDSHAIKESDSVIAWIFAWTKASVSNRFAPFPYNPPERIGKIHSVVIGEADFVQSQDRYRSRFSAYDVAAGHIISNDNAEQGEHVAPTECENLCALLILL
jgi:hypothetical protein